MKKSFLNWENFNNEELMQIVPLIHSFKKENLKNQMFIEPFLGSGSLFLNVDKFDNFIINDTNIQIYMLFKQIKHGHIGFIEDLKLMFCEQTNNKDFFTEEVKKYNSSNDYYKKCLSLIYLNKHSFNNMIRFNQSGKFNSSFVKNKTPYFPEKEIIEMNKKLNMGEVQIFNHSFERIFDNLEYADVIYCNPPQNYQKDDSLDFDYEKHKLLNELAFTASLKGSIVLIYNNYNEISKELYKDCAEYYIKKSKTYVAGKKIEKEKMIAIYA